MLRKQVPPSTVDQSVLPSSFQESCIGKVFFFHKISVMVYSPQFAVGWDFTLAYCSA